MTVGMILEGISFLFLNTDSLIGIQNTAGSFLTGLILHGISCSLSIFPIPIILYGMIY